MGKYPNYILLLPKIEGTVVGKKMNNKTEKNKERGCFSRFHQKYNYD